MKTNIQFLYYLTHFFLEWYVFQIIVVEETYIFGSTAFMFENGVVYEIMWKNIVERSRPQMTIWRMHIACWVPKATNTQAHRLWNT